MCLRIHAFFASLPSATCAAPNSCCLPPEHLPTRFPCTSSASLPSYRQLAPNFLPRPAFFVPQCRTMFGDSQLPPIPAQIAAATQPNPEDVSGHGRAD